MGRRQYDPETKRQAITLASRTSPQHAADELGIPIGTILSWESRHKRATASMAPTRNIEGNELVKGRPVIPKPEPLPWPNRAGTMADDLGDVASRAIATADAYLSEGRVSDALLAMKVADIAMGKAQLLTGGATGRDERRNVDISVSILAIEKSLNEMTRNDMRPLPQGLVIPAETVDEQEER